MVSKDLNFPSDFKPFLEVVTKQHCQKRLNRRSAALSRLMVCRGNSRGMSLSVSALVRGGW